MKVKDIPVWLFFPINDAEPKGWSKDKQSLAERIIISLKRESGFYYWDKKLIKKMLAVNKYDDSTPYGTRTLHHEKPLKINRI